MDLPTAQIPESALLKREVNAPTPLTDGLVEALNCSTCDRIRKKLVIVCKVDEPAADIRSSDPGSFSQRWYPLNNIPMIYAIKVFNKFSSSNALGRRVC